jgi:hypothetical protein
MPTEPPVIQSSSRPGLSLDSTRPKSDDLAGYRGDADFVVSPEAHKFELREPLFGIDEVCPPPRILL